MKRSDELKIQKGTKVARMEALLNLQKGENKRALSDDENTEFENLRAEVEDLNTKIERAQFVEANGGPAPAPSPAPIAAPGIVKREKQAYNTGKAIREFLRGGAETMTGLEAETQQELSRGLSTTGILVPSYSRAITPSDTTTNASAIDMVVDPSLSVFGKAPMWQQMGITVLPGLTSSVKVNKKAAAVAGKVAEKAAVTAQGGSPSAGTLTPERYGITDLFDKELLVQENPAVQAAIINDLVVGADRALTAEVYAVALAAATETTGGALTVDGFNKLMAAVDGNGAFAMSRASFFEAKAVKVDTGSGRFLTSLGAANGFGVTHDGAAAYYSTLFADGTDKQYAIYGDFSEIWAGLWGAVEVLVNPYTYQGKGQVEVTVNRIADMLCRNNAAFAKTPDLDV